MPDFRFGPRGPVADLARQLLADADRSETEDQTGQHSSANVVRRETGRRLLELLQHEMVVAYADIRANRERYDEALTRISRVAQSTRLSATPDEIDDAATVLAAMWQHSASIDVQPTDYTGVVDLEILQAVTRARVRPQRHGERPVPHEGGLGL